MVVAEDLACSLMFVAALAVATADALHRLLLQPHLVVADVVVAEDWACSRKFAAVVAIADAVLRHLLLLL